MFLINYTCHRLTTSRLVAARLLVRFQSSAAKPLPQELLVHRVGFKTLKNLRKPFIYKFTSSWHLTKIPHDGLDVEIDYVDTKPDDSSSPVILALHGAPGSFQDYSKIIAHFGNDIRVLAPNFPDFSLTERAGCFYHSAEEKAELVRDFLAAIDVWQVDLLIAHSAAGYPTSFLWMPEADEDKQRLRIKSLALMNNPGMSSSLTFYREKLLRKHVHLGRFRLFRELFRNRDIDELVKASGVRNKIKDIDSLFLLWYNLYLARYQTMDTRLAKLAQLRIPTFFLFSERDKILSSVIFKNNLSLLGVDLNNIDIYDGNNQLIQSSSANNWIRAVNFKEGGHYCYSTHSDIVHKYLEETLKKGDAIFGSNFSSKSLLKDS